MYHDYFGIEENPFALTPDPRYLFMTQGHQEALAHLLYGVSENGGFVLLTGEVGTGKTSVCRCLLEQLPPEAEVALILNPKLSELELVASICDELGIDYADTRSLKVLVDLLSDHLLRLHSEGRHAVLIIDEAQNLKPNVLEQVRLLTNLETNERKLLQIILIGQPELDDLLHRRELRQLAQRFTSRTHLEPLSAAETKAYIAHRLEVGGLIRETFSSGACAEIYRRSGGVPRLINSLCDRCLLGAYAQETRCVDRKMVRAAATEVFGRRSKSNELRRKIWPSLAAATAIAALLIALVGPRDLWSSAVVAVDTHLARASEPLTATGPLSGPNAEPNPESATEHNPFDETAALQETAEELPATVSAEPVAANAPVLGNLENGEGPRGSLMAAPAVPDTVAATRKVSHDSQSHSSPTESATASVVPDIPEAANSAPLLGEETGQGRDPARRQVAATDFSEPGQTGNLGDLFALVEASDDREAALAHLFDLWRRDYDALAGTEACDKARHSGLRCLSDAQSLRNLVRLNRPTVLILKTPNDKLLHAVLTGHDGDRITLEAGGRRVRAEAADVASVWSGDYLMLWRPPAVYRKMMKQGDKGADVAWLKNRLAQLDGGAGEVMAEATFDEDLKARVMEFQRSHPLLVDGVVGPRTLIYLNNAVGAPGEAMLAARP